MNVTAGFQPGQILYLEHQSSRLYTEVIQVVTERGSCWVRPIALLTLTTPSDITFQSIQFEASLFSSRQLILHDLRQGSDLLCPLSLFHVALDTEVIPILTKLNTLKTELGDPIQSAAEEAHQAHHQLQDFVRRIWKAHPEAF
jgi:hypothetical protein